MRILSWNIQHGGGKRLPRIVEEITAHDPDLIAITEYRAGPGAELRARLLDRGWPHVETSRPAAAINGIAIFSRTPIVPKRPSPAVPEHRVRWLDVHLPQHRFSISVLHIMAAGSGKAHPLNIEKVRFWERVLRAAGTRLPEPFLMIGDWNTGAHRIDETGKTYVCAEHFTNLSRLGWIDMWRRHNPGTTEWTWYSKRKGGARANGFRLDHCFATPALQPSITACRYSHAERDAGVSDHSMMILEVDTAT